MNKVINHLDKYKKWYILGSLIVIAVMWLFVPLVAKNLDYLMQFGFHIGHFSNSPHSSFISAIILINKSVSNSMYNYIDFTSYEIATLCACGFGVLITCIIIPFILKNKYKALYLCVCFIPSFIVLFYVPYTSIYNPITSDELPTLLSPDIGFYIIILILIFITLLILNSIYIKSHYYNINTNQSEQKINNKYTNHFASYKRVYFIAICILSIITILFLPFVYGRCASGLLLERNYRDHEYLIFFEQLLTYAPLTYNLVKDTTQIIIFSICSLLLILNLILVIKNIYKFTITIFLTNLIWVLFNLIFFTTRKTINYPLFNITLHIGFYIMILLTLFSGFLNYAIINNLSPRQKKPKPMELLEIRIDELERKLKDKEENK